LEKKIKEYKDTQIYYGAQTKEFDLNNLSSGIYFFNILSNNNSQTMKFILKGE
jgi:hypothetical protein